VFAKVQEMANYVMQNVV